MGRRNAPAHLFSLAFGASKLGNNSSTASNLKVFLAFGASKLGNNSSAASNLKVFLNNLKKIGRLEAVLPLISHV